MSARRLPRLIVALMVLAPAPLLAEFDALQLEMQRQHEQPLRWDNIEGTPYWINGQRPQRQGPGGQHIVRLAPGQHISVAVPAAEMLRIHKLKGDLSPAELLIAHSNGAGLAQFIDPPAGAGDHAPDWVVAVAGGDEQLFHLQHSGSSAETIELLIYVSRQAAAPEFAPYRDLLTLPGQGINLKRDVDVIAERFWPLGSLAPERQEIEVSGPLRLLLEHRYAYAATEAATTQGYEISVTLDGNPWRTLRYETGPERLYPLTMNGAEVVLGRLEQGYLELPEGRHRLTLQSRAGVYGRLIAQREVDYLLPGLNGPQPSLAEQRKVLQQQESRDTQAQQTAWQLTQENSHREGALLGVAVMAQQASSWPNLRPLTLEAERLLAAHSFYRDLLPDVTAGADAELAWFSPPERVRWQQQGRGRVLAAQHGDIALAKGFFTPLMQQPLVYQIAERLAPSTLRLVLDKNGHGKSSQEQADFMVQYDGQPPIRLRWSSKFVDQQAEWLPGVGESTLALAAQRHGQTDSPLPEPTLTGAFAQYWPPAPQLAVSVVTLPLPQQVRKVTLWREKTEGPPLRLAVQYRASSTYQLTESAYLALEAPSSGEPFDSAGLMRRLADHVENASAAETQLRNHWQGLRRRLLLQQKAFAFGVTPPAPARRGAVFLQPASVGQALAAEQSGAWQTALQQWLALADLTTGTERQQAFMGQARALKQLGEPYLARQLLRGLFLYDNDETLRAAAFDQLAADYRAQDQTVLLQQLYASAILRHPTAATLQGYAELLLADGAADEALLLAMRLPPSEPSAGLLLACAYQTQWWQLFEATLSHASPQQAALWRGYRAQAKGDDDAALREWRSAGRTGDAMAQQLDAGLKIRAALNSATVAARESALQDWQAWQASYPGVSVWQNAPQLVSDSAGAALLYVIERDLLQQTHRATQARPVKLRLFGPAQLRLKIRPVHEANTTTALDGWLQLKEMGATGERSSVLPINGNWPASGLQWMGHEQRQPGDNEVLEYAVGAGLHELELSAAELELLVDVAVRRPQMPLAVLPPMTVETVAAVLSPRQADAGRVQCSDAVAPLFICRQHDVTEAPTHRPSPDLAALSKRLSLEGGVTPDTTGLHHTPSVVTPAPDQKGGAPREQMIRLLWRAEQQPEQLQHLIAAARQLSTAHPDDIEMQALAARLAQPLEWQPLPAVEQSAGIRHLPLSGWQPESPAAQTRKALLGIDDPALYIITGRAQLGLAMSNQEAVNLRLTLAQAALPSVPTERVAVSYRVDEGEARVVELGEGELSLQIRMPSGNHRLRLALLEPRPNQFVAVRLWERPAAHPGRAETAVVRQYNRPYHIATTAEPVRLQLKGPGLLRIDELTAAGSRQSYRALAPGWQRLELAPATGMDEALYRLERYLPAADVQRVVALERPAAPLQPVPRPSLSVTTPAALVWLTPEDGLPLAGQEDGTWSFGGLLASRRQVEQEYGRRDSERFMELRADHRHYDPYNQSYYQGRLLGRLRDEGGPTLGMQGWWEHQPRWRSWRVAAQGSLYLQSPEGGNEWAALVSGDIEQRRELGLRTFHSPYGSLFQRWMSLNNFGSYPQINVDQDIFTRYKGEHRRGLVVGDRLVHSPWLDTEWYGDLALTTNESLIPFTYDNINLTLGWKQLLGPWLATAEYGQRYYRADGDRNDSLNRGTLSLNLEWNQWQRQWQRWQLWTKLQHNLNTAENSLWLGLVWHGGNGRGLRDFRPGEMSFRNLREQQLPPQPNNRVQRRGDVE